MSDKKISIPQQDTFEGLSKFRPPLCFELVGKTFELVMDDGFEYELSFSSREALFFGRTDESKTQYRYECLKAEALTYFVNFEVPAVTPRTGISFIIDVEQSLITWVTLHLGCNPSLPRMPTSKIIFGAIRKADGTVPTIRHGYTSEVTGAAVEWNYGTFGIVHVYSSERYYRVAFSREALERMMAANPDRPRPQPGEMEKRPVYEDAGEYIKIKDGLYVISFIEQILCRQNGHGNNLLFLMNFNELHDVGRSFGTNGEGFDENYTFGAFGTYFDASETLARKSTYHIR